MLTINHPAPPGLAITLAERAVQAGSTFQQKRVPPSDRTQRGLGHGCQAVENNERLVDLKSGGFAFKDPSGCLQMDSKFTVLFVGYGNGIYRSTSILLVFAVWLRQMFG